MGQTKPSMMQLAYEETQVFRGWGWTCDFGRVTPTAR